MWPVSSLSLGFASITTDNRSLFHLTVLRHIGCVIYGFLTIDLGKGVAKLVLAQEKLSGPSGKRPTGGEGASAPSTLKLSLFWGEATLARENTISACLKVLWLCLWLLYILVGQTILEYWLSLPVLPFSLTSALKWSLMISACCGVEVGPRGNRERIGAYHTSPSSYWQESACSSVGEHTCILRGQRSERNAGRMVGGGEGEINACQAFNLREVLVVEPKRFHCSKHCFISLFVSACSCVMSSHYAFMRGG